MFVPVMVFHQSEQWVLNHKVTFDIARRYIIINEGVTDLDIQVDVYSDMKEWMGLDERHRRQRPPVRVIGGDDTTAGQKAGDIYFMQHGWRLVIDPTVVSVTGALFSDDFSTAFLTTGSLEPFNPVQVSSLVTGTNIDVPSSENNADAVLDAVLDDHNIEGSTADILKIIQAVQALVSRGG